MVDANVWLSGLAKPTSAPGIVISQTINGNLTPVFSRTSWGELAEVLHRPKILRWLSMSGLEATEYLDALEQIAQFVTPLKRVPVAVRDVKDIPLLAAAPARPVATALITGDMDLLVLQGQVNTDVISPSDFVGKYLLQ